MGNEKRTGTKPRSNLHFEFALEHGFYREMVYVTNDRIHALEVEKQFIQFYKTCAIIPGGWGVNGIATYINSEKTMDITITLPTLLVHQLDELVNIRKLNNPTYSRSLCVLRYIRSKLPKHLLKEKEIIKPVLK